MNEQTKTSRCKKCGYRIPTDYLVDRFKAGLGSCPGCLDRDAEFEIVNDKPPLNQIIGSDEDKLALVLRTFKSMTGPGQDKALVRILCIIGELNTSYQRILPNKEYICVNCDANLRVESFVNTNGQEIGVDVCPHCSHDMRQQEQHDEQAKLDQESQVDNG